MKKIQYLYSLLSMCLIALCFQSCDKGVLDIDKVQEHLDVQASSSEIVLDGENLKDDIITFNWEEARAMSDDYIVSYTTKLDVVGNNFGSSTTILSYEDDGVFSRSFTSEQIQNWANEKWKLPVNQPFTLQFRVVAQWEGGPTFEAPEVRTITVQVQPIKTVVFEANNVFLGGSAVPGMTRVEINKTLENESQYAYFLDLEAGDLEIPVEFNGATNYICPTSLDGSLEDSVAVAVNMLENPIPWKIEKAGKYRIVVNMQKATVTIYSPDKALNPAVVQWTLDGIMQTTTVNDIWEYGEPTGWAWREGNWKQSAADPQLFVYTGPALNGRTKFGVYPINQSYVYTGNNTASNTSVSHGTTYDLIGGYAANERNAYFSLPSGTNFIVLDIRNKTMLANKK
ncbi:SusE domain-containing protein [Sphingobacterium sp. LRF_L2]|uniref:SusE domain-containing protein n=1 Tax=Sphingobacterium sp. LRF_L2 TaxID=3369421 RepID=UPI003F630FB5